MKTYETCKGVEDYIKMCKGYDTSEFKTRIMNNITIHKSMLEIGMGPGNDFLWLKSIFEMTGSDYSEEFIKRAKIRFPDSEIILLDGITLNIDRNFDSIFSSKVFQHIDLIELKTALNNQHNILNKKGLIIHTFWIGDTESDFDDMHFYYHDRKKLLDLISEKFNILDTKIYEEFEPDDSIFIIAEKK